MPARAKDVTEREVKQAILTLKKGAHILECGGRGNPRFHSFRLSSDEKFLIWNTGEAEKNLKLDSITKIILGQHTAIFRHLALPEKRNQSFSLIYQNGERSLDLICMNVEQAESWILGLTSLISTYCCTLVVSDFRNNNDFLDDSSSFSQPYIFNGPDPSSKPKHSSSSQSATELRLPQLPKIIFHTIKDRIREKKNYLNKTKSAIIKPQTSITDGSSKDLYMWGEGIPLGGGDGGRLTKHGNGVVLDTLLPVLLLEASGILDIRSISCGRNHTGVVTDQGEVFCWGEDNGGGLGHKINIDVPCPKIVESLKAVHVVTIECGGDHTCALTNSGELYGWGDSSHGAEVLDHQWKRNNWIPHKFSGALDGIRVERVACGDWHTAVVSSTGHLFTFGIGTFGVLGHGNSDDVLEPKEVESLKGLRVKSVACGPWHTAAIVEIMIDRFRHNSPGGKLFTWGDDERGRLGHGDSGDKRFLLPTCVASLVDCDFIQVSCGYTITIGLTVTGKVFTMGSSESGQLGSPFAGDNSITAVEGCLQYKSVKKIASGPYHVVALTTKGEVYCWGKGANGRLGLGDTDDRNSPTLVQSFKDKPVETIACGSKFTAAICSSDKFIVSEDHHHSICKGCKLAFSFTRRHHSCYYCGFSFCNSCMSKRSSDAILPMRTIRTKHFRVCGLCFARLEKKSIHSDGGGSKMENCTPRLARFTRTTSAETSSASSPYFLHRQTSVEHGKDLISDDNFSLPMKTQRWGHVSCPPQFTSNQAKPEVPSNSSSKICPQENTANKKPLILDGLELKPELCDGKNKAISKELHRLQAEVQSLTKECHVKSEKIRIYKQRNNETWSVAKAEAEKCKAAKDVIKVLTTQINAMSRKVNARGGRGINKLNVEFLCDGNEAKKQDEWMEQDNPGVYINFLRLPTGKKSLARVRFSRKHFSEKEAKTWWDENQTRVHLKYDIEQTL